MAGGSPARTGTGRREVRVLIEGVNGQVRLRLAFQRLWLRWRCMLWLLLVVWMMMIADVLLVLVDRRLLKLQLFQLRL